MIIHVKPDQNHRPTYIYEEEEEEQRHPDLPPGAITVGDVFRAIKKGVNKVVRVIKVIRNIIGILIITWGIVSLILMSARKPNTSYINIPVNTQGNHFSGMSAAELIANQ